MYICLYINGMTVNAVAPPKFPTKNALEKVMKENHSNLKFHYE